MSIYVIFTYICIISLILLGIVYKHSKILFLIQSIFMMVLVVFNYWSADYINNYNIYLSASENDPIINNFYGMFGCMFKRVGIEFYYFNFILSGISMLLILIYIYRKSINSNFVLSLMWLYPFCNYVIQKKWLVAFAISLYAMNYLYTNNKKNSATYLILIILAAQFHPAAYFYLLFYFIDYISDKYKKYIIYVMVLVGMIFVEFIPKIIRLFFSDTKVNLYFMELASKSSISKFIFWIFTHITIYMIVVYIKKTISIDNIYSKEVQRIYKINLSALVVIPLYYFDPVFFRIYSLIILLDYIHIANLLPKINIYYRKQFVYFLYIILCSIYLFIIFFVVTGLGFDILVTDIIENNYFFNYIYR
ncbi:EpsG family protein [Clostridium butyricum]|uniref:EpsG family protein n=2 Tax=Clostridium butyricum TaxID=1492 RepID=UPI00071E20F8|nr:EpsG family protein [Clostridium butyricum]MCQ2015584.1 EpsG family protein [Clostridium butyricum]